MLNKLEILELLGKYNFIEVSQVRFFIDFFCFDKDMDAEVIYIFCKIMKCLSLHDNGDDYFNDMRSLVAEMKKNIAPCFFGDLIPGGGNHFRG